MKNNINDMSKEPLVTMITVFYNRGYCVSSSVQSMIDQDYKNLELILVDDGSTDNTLLELRKFESDGVKVITHDNIGFTKSIKRAIEEISLGELIAIHGSGDISVNSRINEQVLCFKSDETLALFGCQSVNVQESSNAIIDIQDFPRTKVSASDFVHAPPFTHGCAMFKKDISVQVGGYNERFTYCQD